MRHYVFIDYATQAYIALIGLLILLFHGDAVASWPLLVSFHALGLVLVHLLIQVHAARPTNRGLDFLRHFYPVLLYAAFFRETGMLNRMFVPAYLDVHFIAFEQSMFGFQPCIAFMEAAPYLVVSEVFYASYFSYYIMISGVGLTLFFRERQRFFHYVSVVSFVFYGCYLTYVILPVMGPRCFFRVIDGFQLPPSVQALAGSATYPEAVRSGPFFQIMAWIYRHFEGAGAAFPSSHVAVAIVTVWFSFLYLRPIRWYHFTVVLLLCLSTVYCRYHYAVDVAAGVVAAMVLTPLGNLLYRRLSGAAEGRDDAGCSP